MHAHLSHLLRNASIHVKRSVLTHRSPQTDTHIHTHTVLNEELRRDTDRDKHDSYTD